MAIFSQKSKDKLATCDDRLQTVFNIVIAEFDCTILAGHRGESEQNALYNSEPKKSQLKFPDSKHNLSPSKAVDVAPYPIDWNDRERFSFFAGRVLTTAEHLGIKMRWGGDWNNDTMLADNKFDDLPHFELI